jgi:hypothetical protein
MDAWLYSLRKNSLNAVLQWEPNQALPAAMEERETARNALSATAKI